MRSRSKIIFGFCLALVALGMLVLPVLAANSADWWKPYVDVKIPVKLEPYKGSYWAAILFPGFLDCESASLMVGNQLFIGDIEQHWWWFRSCEVTFTDVPANTSGTFTINYTANGTWSYQKGVTIGKTWQDTIYRPKILLPWIEY